MDILVIPPTCQCLGGKYMINHHVGALLAGGLSSRMGQDKSTLKWNGVTLLEHSYAILQATQCQDIVVSHNSGSGVKDRFPQCGPLGGIDAVLQHVSSNCWLTVVPVDMPKLQSASLVALQQFAERHQQACYYENCFLPCVIPANESVKRYVEQQLVSQSNLTIRGVLNLVNAVALPPTFPETLINTNTPEQWRHATQGMNNLSKENNHVKS